ncbi:MAG TPA: MFS transporter [Solirubrobacteraceae bacterium]|jgi:EmrB/QacA subfamily drug resistance transporter|nr:MFS transporter [Solirubrobacteraceae bacterium]
MTERIRALQMHDGNRRWWALGAMCFALFMIMLDNTVVNVALPSIQRSLNASTSSLEWTVNAYTLSFAVLLVTGGRLGDLFGRRKVFLAGVVIFASASAAIGFSPSDTWLVAWRAVQGVGSALMMPATLSIITNAFPPQERGKAIGTWAGVSAMALAIGPVVGGFLVESVSWQSIFFLNVPVAVGAVVIALFAVRESRDETVARSVDIPGVATLTIGLAALVLALVEGNEWGWGSARELAMFAVAAIGLSAFALVERRRSSPMVDFSFFRSRTFLGANIVAFIVSFAMLAMFFFLALYMQNIRGYSPLQAGVRFLPSTVMIIVIAPLAGRLADRVGSRPLITFGLLCVSGALFWQSHLTVSSGYGALLPGFMLMGVGMGFVMSPMSLAAMNAVDRTKAGVASGILSMNRMVGGTFGVAILGALVATLGRSKIDELLPQLPDSARAKLAGGLGSGGVAHGVPARVVDGAQQAFVYALHYGLLLGSAVALLGALTAFLLIRKRSDEQVEAQAGDVEASVSASAAPREASSAKRGPAPGASSEPEPRRREPETVNV